MTEAILAMGGMVCLAALTTWSIEADPIKPKFAAFRARWTRRAVMNRLGHWAFAWVAGDKAREAAKAGYYEGLKGKV